MAKKKKTGRDDCPPWVRKLDANGLKRLNGLRKIVEDPEICEMEPGPTIRHLRSGTRSGLWLVGKLDPASGSKKR